MAARVPRIEVADHRHPLGVGRPDREAHTLDAVDGHDVGAERLGQAEMPALVEQMQIELAQQRTEGIGILGFLHCLRPLYAQQIGRGVRYRPFEQAGCLAFDQCPQRRSIGPAQHLDRLRARQEDANAASARAVVRAQHIERIAMARRRQRFDVGTIQPAERRGGHDATLGAAVSRRLAMRARPLTGMASQLGRLAAS